MAAPSGAPLVTHTKYDVRDAVVALYPEAVKSTAVSERFLGVDRRRAAALVAQLPSGLVNDAQRRTLQRAANKVAGADDDKRAYTDWELRRLGGEQEIRDTTTKKDLLRAPLRAKLQAHVPPPAAPPTAAEAPPAGAAMA